MLIVNMFGGPGTGKSSTAAGVFSKLKWKGVNCELVTEYAKDVVWEESYKKLENQIYIFGKQLHRIWRISDKVDVCITDSPILLSLVYNEDGSDNFKGLVLDEYNKFDTINIFLTREKPYNEVGRTQNEEKAKELDKKIRGVLYSNRLPHTILPANEANMDKIVSLVLNELNWREWNKGD